MHDDLAGLTTFHRRLLGRILTWPDNTPASHRRALGWPQPGFDDLLQDLVDQDLVIREHHGATTTLAPAQHLRCPLTALAAEPLAAELNATRRTNRWHVERRIRETA